jgi:hypothetical protein
MRPPPIGPGELLGCIACGAHLTRRRVANTCNRDCYNRFYRDRRSVRPEEVDAIPEIAPAALAGVRRIRCRHCGYRVFEDWGLDGRTFLTCSGCARMLAEVVEPKKERIVRGRRYPARRRGRPPGSRNRTVAA